MLQSFLMLLREGFESFLIVAIILSYLETTGRRALRGAVFLGSVVAVLASFGLGFILMKGVNQALWEAILGSVTIVLVGSLVIHMWKAAPRMKQEIHAKLESVSGNRPGGWAFLGVFLFTLVMIAREGMETALMLLQVRDSGVLTGIFLGLAAASVVSWIWVRYSHAINLKLFFRVTGVFLMLFMVQVAIYAFHEFAEAGVIPNSEYWHELTEPYSPYGIYGQWFSVLMVGGTALWLVSAHLWAHVFDSKKIHA